MESGAEVGKPADKNGLVRIREDSSIFVKLEVCIRAKCHVMLLCFFIVCSHAFRTSCLGWKCGTCSLFELGGCGRQ